MAEDFKEWLDRLGIVTRTTMVASLIMTAVSSFEIVSAYYFVLLWMPSTYFQLWRPFTAAFFFGNFSFAWLMNMLMFVTYMNYCETNEFNGKMADFLWMLLFIIVGLTPLGIVMRTPVLSFALTMSICWIFCRRNPEMQMSLFGFNFKASIFPWVLLLFHVILGGQGVIHDILGIIVGHAYIFLHDVLPRTHGIQVMQTPQWFNRRIEMWLLQPRGVNRGAWTEVHPNTSGFTAWRSRAGDNDNNSTNSSRHSWGSGGRRLGAE